MNEGALVTYAVDEITEVFESLVSFTDKMQSYVPGGDSGASMQRSGNMFWKPVQQQGMTESGWSLTSPEGVLELSIGGSLGTPDNAYRQLRADDLRDESSFRRAVNADAKKLLADMEYAGLEKAAKYGSFCVTNTAAFGSSWPVWDGLADAESRMFDTEFNMNSGSSTWINSTTYRAGGKELVEGSAHFSKSVPDAAYKQGEIQKQIAGIGDVSRHNKLINMTAQATAVEIDGAQTFNPIATESSANGSDVPFDNRFATITVDTTTGVNVGDKFKVAGMAALSLEQKVELDYDQTFTVAAVASATTLTISPRPIALDDGSLSDLEATYANVSTSFADTDSLVWLNTTARRANVVMCNDAMVLASSPIPLNHELFKQLNSRSFSVGPINGVIGFESDLGALTGAYRIAIWYDWQVEKPEQVGVILDAQA